MRDEIMDMIMVASRCTDKKNEKEVLDYFGTGNKMAKAMYKFDEFIANLIFKNRKKILMHLCENEVLMTPLVFEVNKIDNYLHSTITENGKVIMTHISCDKTTLEDDVKFDFIVGYEKENNKLYAKIDSHTIYEFEM